MQEAAQRGTDAHLTACFKLNTTFVEARQYLYADIPKHYTFNKKTGVWKPRKLGGYKILSRMYSASPRDHEKYSFRALLLHVTGARSYEYIRSYNGVISGGMRCSRTHGKRPRVGKS